MSKREESGIKGWNREPDRAERRKDIEKRRGGDKEKGEETKKKGEMKGG